MLSLQISKSDQMKVHFYLFRKIALAMNLAVITWTTWLIFNLARSPIYSKLDFIWEQRSDDQLQLRDQQLNNS